MPKIEELLEAADGLEALVLAILEVGADGFQWIEDGTKLALDSDLRDKIVRALEGVDQIPAELNDLDLEEQRVLAHRLVDLQHNIRAALEQLGEQDNG